MLIKPPDGGATRNKNKLYSTEILLFNIDYDMNIFRKNYLNAQHMPSLKNWQKLKYSSILGVLFALLMVSQSEADSVADASGLTLKKVQTSQWQKLYEKKIFFGYRSVGRNIIEGIRDLSREYPQIRFNFKTPEDSVDNAKGFFLHHWVDMEQSPQSLVMLYTSYIDKKMPGREFDIAMIRFTPFYGKKDIDSILEDYAEAVDELKTEFQKTIFVHATFPLTHAKETWRTWLKKVLKKDEIWEYGNNSFINEYNKLMRESYKGKEPFFDIAEIQSTFPNGERSTFTRSGQTYYHMVGEYTSDGTHLNEKGRRIVAEQLLLFLIGLI